MISKLKNELGAYWHSRKDWSTKEKLIVIESDDWGSIRMPSKEAFDALKNAGIRVDSSPFSMYDNLETEEDFLAMESTFDRIFKKTGKKPVITANYILANPDFEKIRKNNFEHYERKYFWDHLDELNLLESYKNNYQRLSEKENFFAQLHGMEHVHFPYWMNILQENSPKSRMAFDYNIYGLSLFELSDLKHSFLASYDYFDQQEYHEYMSPAIKSSQQSFEKFFGYKSLSFIAPNYTWSQLLEKDLSESGVKYLQSGRKQILPACYGNATVKRNLGEKNEFGQTYLIRNSYFEPSSVKDKKEHVRECYRRIESAFRFKKPAIISAHRLNFMGGIDKANREENLILFEELMLKIIKRWPNVRFINSVELGKMINEND